MSVPPVDLCQYVFTCSMSDWQIQVSPGARSDLGGAVETYTAICEAHMHHVVDDHSPAQLDAMQAELREMGAPLTVTDHPDGLKASYMNGVPLPGWWRE